MGGGIYTHYGIDQTDSLLTTRFGTLEKSL